LLGWYAWYESGERVYLALFYTSLALGALAKGPVAPFLAAVIVVLFAGAKRDLRLTVRTLWIPGVLLFCAVALPWYVAVQIRNPDFLRIFIFQHNLARFGTNLYHHREPFWYYLPVTLLALVPWTVFIAASFVETMRAWWSERKALFGTSFQDASAKGTASAVRIDSYQGTAPAVPPAAYNSSGFSRGRRRRRRVPVLQKTLTLPNYPAADPLSLAPKRRWQPSLAFPSELQVTAYPPPEVQC